MDVGLESQESVARVAVAGKLPVWFGSDVED
jgi:hypothetical protein